jgi:crotonobetainyl-CoA:carnitine CoA-transferase CaiB-like acyl-CoA transferase
VGRISAIGALAGLIRKHRTGVGARIHVSQAEAAINQLDTIYVTQAAEVSGVGEVLEDGAVHRVLACAGDDEWCVVSLRSEADRRAVALVVDGDLAAWVAARSPAEATEALQAAGVPVGPMNRPGDVHDDPQLRLRNVFSDMAHPLFEHPLVTEAGPAHYRIIPPAPQNPAPLPGADTRRVCRDVLGLTADEVEALVADGVLFTAADRTGVGR